MDSSVFFHTVYATISKQLDEQINIEIMILPPCEIITVIIFLFVVSHSPTFTSTFCVSLPTQRFKDEPIACYAYFKIVQRIAAFALFAKSLAFSLRSLLFENEID